jgi:hypothetical protein
VSGTASLEDHNGMHMITHDVVSIQRTPSAEATPRPHWPWTNKCFVFTTLNLVVRKGAMKTRAHTRK